MANPTSSFMEAAIAKAKEGVEKKLGGPFGACIVQDGRIVSCSHNTVPSDKDPTCHAEVNAIREACRALDTSVLHSCEIHTTSEPCPMCMGAIKWAGIPKVYVGAPKTMAEEFSFDDVKFENADFEEFKFVGVEKKVRKIFELWVSSGGKPY